ncbi:DUF3667 domain-containing protein [Hellea sp.]|nr:DUF3667 domain-containing protein [Hellea sp.]
MGRTCKNCSTDIAGVYCHDCGEKVLSDEDFHVTRYIGGFFSGLTNLDSKIYRTLKAFLIRPGQLSADYLSGIRKPFLSPVQIFLIVTVIFFVFAPVFDIFYIPAKWFFANMTSENSNYVNVLAMERMADLDLSRNELAIKYDVSVKNNSRAFLFLAIPFLALGSYLSRPKAVPQFGKHMIFSTYNLSFLILWTFALLTIAFKLPNTWTPDSLMRSLLFGGIFLYLVLATRRTWADNWPRAVFSGALQLVIFFLFFLAYRSGISLATLYSL